MNQERYDSPSQRIAGSLRNTRKKTEKKAWSELQIVGRTKTLSPELWTFNFLTGLHLNGNRLSELPAEICQLESLQLLDASNNQLRHVPEELGDIHELRELQLHNNRLLTLPYAIGKLFQLQNITLQGNQLPQDLMQLCQSGAQQLVHTLLDNYSYNSSQPPERPWIALSQASKNTPAAVFTVMCYNVLCEKYCTRQLYGYCPSWALMWSYRRKGIMQEIRNYSADIISLQEVEADMYQNFFLPNLAQDGYDGCFASKSRARTMLESERKHVDGCAIFYKKNKFRLVNQELIEFNQMAMAAAEGCDDMLNRVQTKDNICISAVFEITEESSNGVWTGGVRPTQHVLVATAHIHWDPEFCDVKLIQTIMLMTKLRTTVENFQREHGLEIDVNSVPFILCGDLNSLPDSGVVEYLSSSVVRVNHEDFKGIDYSQSLHRLREPDDKDVYKHAFQLRSSYNEQIMPYTNYTYDFRGTIDYIFYSEKTLTPLGLLGPLDPLWLKQNKIIGCPHPHVPSDHFSLLVELEMPLIVPKAKKIEQRSLAANRGSHGKRQPMARQ